MPSTDDPFTSDEWTHMEAIDKRFGALHNEGAMFHNWMDVGSVYLEIRARAMFLAETNEPIGKRYNAVWATIHQTARSRLPNITNDLDDGTRSLAMKMAEHREKLTVWWRSLNQNIRQKTNHPKIVLHNYDKGHADKLLPDKKPRKRAATTRDRFELAEEEADRIRSRMVELESEILVKEEQIEELEAIIRDQKMEIDKLSAQLEKFRAGQLRFPTSKRKR